MNPPDRVWIGAEEYALLVVPSDHEKVDGGESDGYADRAAATIYIRDGLTPCGVLETVWHELTHAVDWAGGIEDGAIEEDIADRHAKIWSQFWINNPRFAKWWMDACEEVRKARQGKRRRG